jgi:hypothetical protein
VETVRCPCGQDLFIGFFCVECATEPDWIHLAEALLAIPERARAGTVGQLVLRAIVASMFGLCESEVGFVLNPAVHGDGVL